MKDHPGELYLEAHIRSKEEWIYFKLSFGWHKNINPLLVYNARNSGFFVYRGISISGGSIQ